ncbi:MAG: RIO1 family regulatory kinase/ATPase domain-containing protein [Candidatus Methanomethylicaceae archaeon]
MAEVISVEDERAKVVLSYPRYLEEFYRKVLTDLRGIGVDGVISEGKIEINRFRVLGKGCVGIVLLGLLRGEEVALKVLRVDADRRSLRREGDLLKIVNGAGIGPKIVAVKDTVIAMEYIKGETFLKWLSGQGDTDAVRRVVKELLAQCYTLDRIGIDHGELSEARKHILIDEKGRPRIIDFETASIGRRCRNLVSMAGYILLKKSVSNALRRHISWDDGRVKSILKEYKMAPSLENYEKILRELGF